MRLLTRRTMLLIATALCLVAQGAIATPECRCADRESAPPCHQPAPIERGACCAGGEELPASSGCSHALQLSCCGSTAAPAAETAGIAVVDHGGETALGAPDLEIEEPAAVPAPVIAPTSPPAPRGAPAWLLNSTLRN